MWRELKKTCPQDEALLTRATSVKTIDDEAVAWASLAFHPHLTPREPGAARVAPQHVCEQHVWERCQSVLQEDIPQQTRWKRVESLLPERFVFVVIPGVPAHTTLAERRVRPLVSARTISGSSRSPKGSQTRMGLAHLFGTWIAQGLHPFSPCLALLTPSNP